MPYWAILHSVYALQHLIIFWSFTGALYVPFCVHLLLCITVYMCPSVCFLVHTYVYMCPHMFFIIWHLYVVYFAVIYYFCIILILVHFCDLHVYLTCAGMWAICVFHKTHPFGSNSKFAGYRDFDISFVYLVVCFVCYEFLFGFIPFFFSRIFFLTTYTQLYCSPFSWGLPIFCGFVSGFV